MLAALCHVKSLTRVAHPAGPAQRGTRFAPPDDGARKAEQKGATAMFTRFNRATVVIGLTCAIGLAPLSGGCSNLPGNKGTQGAVIGGLGGAAAGAIIGKKNRGIG